MSDDPIPDWLRGVVRYVHTGYEQNLRPTSVSDEQRALVVGGEGEWMRVTDVVAAAQEQDADLRRLLWANHQCSLTTLYGDDGEMQCNATHVNGEDHAIGVLDFRRMPVHALASAICSMLRYEARRAEAAERALEQAQHERDAANAEAERLRDLVRYQRAELHDAKLISDEEYADLVSNTPGAVPRLEGYDDLRKRLDAAEAAREATLAQAQQAVEFHRDMAARFEEDRHELKQRVRTAEAAAAGYRGTADRLREQLDACHPTLCYQQETTGGIVQTFKRCDRPRGHQGPHSWELPDLTALRAAVAAVPLYTIRVTVERCMNAGFGGEAIDRLLAVLDAARALVNGATP